MPCRECHSYVDISANGHIRCFNKRTTFVQSYDPDYVLDHMDESIRNDQCQFLMFLAQTFGINIKYGFLQRAIHFKATKTIEFLLRFLNDSELTSLTRQRELIRDIFQLQDSNLAVQTIQRCYTIDNRIKPFCLRSAMKYSTLQLFIFLQQQLNIQVSSTIMSPFWLDALANSRAFIDFFCYFEKTIGPVKILDINILISVIQHDNLEAYRFLNTFRPIAKTFFDDNNKAICRCCTNRSYNILNYIISEGSIWTEAGIFDLLCQIDLPISLQKHLAATATSLLLNFDSHFNSFFYHEHILFHILKNKTVCRQRYIHYSNNNSQIKTLLSSKLQYILLTFQHEIFIDVRFIDSCSPEPCIIKAYVRIDQWSDLQWNSEHQWYFAIRELVNLPRPSIANTHMQWYNQFISIANMLRRAFDYFCIPQDLVNTIVSFV